MKNVSKTAAETAMKYLGGAGQGVTMGGKKVDNFNGMTARPGFAFYDFTYAFKVNNTTGDDQWLALSNGFFSTAAALSAAGFSVDALMGDGILIDGANAGEDLVLTASRADLNAAFFAEFVKDNRVWVERIRLTSDQESQFSEEIITGMVTPISDEGTKTIRIEPYFSVNQNSTKTADMVLRVHNEQFWLSNINLAKVKVVDNSELRVIMSMKVELPA